MASKPFDVLTLISCHFWLKLLYVKTFFRLFVYTKFSCFVMSWSRSPLVGRWQTSKTTCSVLKATCIVKGIHDFVFTEKLCNSHLSIFSYPCESSWKAATKGSAMAGDITARMLTVAVAFLALSGTGNRNKWVSRCVYFQIKLRFAHLLLDKVKFEVIFKHILAVLFQSWKRLFIS